MKKWEPGELVEYTDALGSTVLGMVDRVDAITGRVYVELQTFPGRRSEVWFDRHEVEDRLRARS